MQENSDGTIRGLIIWSMNLGWSNPLPGPPAGSSDTSGPGAPFALLCAISAEAKTARNNIGDDTGIGQAKVN
jgi:hypothetical protein